MAATNYHYNVEGMYSLSTEHHELLEMLTMKSIIQNDENGHMRPMFCTLIWKFLQQVLKGDKWLSPPPSILKYAFHTYINQYIPWGPQGSLAERAWRSTTPSRGSAVPPQTLPLVPWWGSGMTTAASFPRNLPRTVDYSARTKKAKKLTWERWNTLKDG